MLFTMLALDAMFVGVGSYYIDKITSALKPTHGISERIEVATPDDAIERLSDHPPDCIVSEYELSGMTGIEFLQEVRDDYPHLPVIFFTASGDDAVASRAFSDRATDYLPKDTADSQFERLAERITEFVNQSTVEQEWKHHSSVRDHEQRLFQRVQEIADIGAWTYDVQTGDGSVTEKVSDIHGLSKDESISVEKSISLYDEGDQSTICDAFDRAVTDGEPYDLKLGLTGADGVRRTVRTQGDPQIEDGTVVSVQGTIQDITEQAERQRELQLFRQAIDDADVSITLADPSQDDQPLVYVNDAFEEVTGYSRDDALGRNCRFLQGEDTDPAKVTTLRKAINNEEQVTVDLRNYRKDGTEFWNRLSIKPIYDDSGQLVRYLGTQQDITTRKQRTKELTAERRLMNQAYNSMDDLFYVLDENGCFQRWNTRVPEVTGYTDAELSDMHALNIFTEDEKPKIADAIERVLNGQRITVQAALRTADDQTRPFEFNGARLTDSDGSTTGLVGIGRDITERTERQEYLELLNRVLRHNLRNSMNVIRGQAELLQETSTCDTQPDAETIIQECDELTDIGEKGRELAELVQDRPTYTELGADQLLRRVAGKLRAEYPNAAIEITCPDGVTLHASTQFSRAIEELMTNAIVHNDASSPKVSVDVTAGDAESVLAITDNGPQIPEVERQLLLDNGERTQLYHGSGLGLSLVRLIVTRSGGSIRYEESSTTGNRVILEIPDPA